MKKLFQFLSFFLLVSFLSLVLRAESGEKLIIVRGDGYWPPYEWLEQGLVKGFHIDLVMAVAIKLDLNIWIESYPWKRAIKMVKEGDADAITFIAKTKEREKFLYYKDENQLHLSKSGLISIKDRNPDFRFSGDLKQIKNMIICAQFGHFYGKRIEEATYLNIDRGAKTTEQLIYKLANGRCELAIGYRYVKEVAKEKGISSELVNLRPYISVHPMYIAFSKVKQREKLANRFAVAMSEFKASPRYRKLVGKYQLSKSRQVKVKNE